ncbi:hypothetical protein ACLVWU_04740 [Bdellovibrio sp. HCB290]|uniref:bestrophin-like domain n=1 Tax=Bdellovibrio sp. HCB290 TaxID=3394356 RepID=UPI0039B6E1D2
MYETRLWISIVIMVVLLLVAVFIGTKFGQKFGKPDANYAVLPTSILGLLALLLGFTFSMSVSRFEDRQKLVLSEANAIGTTYLRTDFLPAPHAQNVKSYLREYVDIRLKLMDDYPTENEARRIGQETARLQSLIWNETVAAAGVKVTPLSPSFVSSLNDVIDISAQWDFVLNNTVPEMIYFIIIFVAVFGVFFLGFMNGSTGTSHRFGILALAFLFSLVIALIQDLDRPRRGTVKVSQSSLVDLKKQISK